MKIGVYGLGRFGSFWKNELAGFADVTGYSRSGNISEEEVLACDTVILCVSISAMEEVVKRIAPRLKPGTMVMDTCSVKMYPAEVMEKYLPPEIEIIATHPMFGPDSARSGIRGLPFIFSPVRVSEERSAYWHSFFENMGIKVYTMTPEEHDREAAYTQGITHYLGRVLADLNLKSSPIGTLGYNKLLEIIEQTCNDSWQLFLDLQRYNPFTREMRQKVYSSQEKIFAELELLNKI